MTCQCIAQHPKKAAFALALCAAADIYVMSYGGAHRDDKLWNLVFALTLSMLVAAVGIGGFVAWQFLRATREHDDDASNFLENGKLPFNKHHAGALQYAEPEYRQSAGAVDPRGSEVTAASV